MKYNQPTKRFFASIRFVFLLGLAMSLLTAVKTNATTTNVSTAAALQTAINNASAGDVIILANGTYLNSTLSITKSNITVKAATPGGVYWNSDVNPSSLLATAGGNRITISGNYVNFSGFQFTSGDIGLSYIVEITGDHNVVTQLNFSGYYAQKYIHINDGSQYNEITFCNLEKKPAAAASGCTIQISTSATVPGYHKIRYCSFQNYEGIGGDFGNEPIRIGLSTENNNASRSIVEHCYFNNTGLGDSESVSIKSMENTIRFCTFTNQQNAMLCFRNGDNNAAYSNFFINAGGIRVKEANNIYCYNNYFYNSGVGSSADAVTLMYVAPVDLRTSNLVNVNFIHNTFVDCGYVDMGGTGATSNTWANNIFKKSSGSIFTNANSGTTWAGNIRSGTLGITIASGITNIDPLLTTNTDAYYGLSSTSPAIDAASSSYPAILDIANIDDDPTLAYDISGQTRPSLATSKDVGADENTTGTTTNRPLAVTEVGPNYLGGPSIAVSTQPIAASICSGSNTSFTASSTSTMSPTTVQWQRSANSGTTWTNITANLDAATTYSGFTSETLVLTGSSSAINNYQYKAVFTNTIGSVDSNVVALTVVTTALPTGTATKTICGAATVASLTGYVGTALQWYAALTGGTALATTTALTTGNYYVSQTLNGCESARKTVAVTVTSPAPTASSLLLCSGSTVSDLTATGTSLKWYAAATGGSQLSSGTTLSTTTYYVSQTVSACESSRTAVSVEIYVPASLPVLNADGPGNTYELITSVLAPCQGVAAVEAPDMLDGSVAGTHPTFGRHIAEVMDTGLGKYVFEFYSHVAEDNDITGGLDRERVEIKTYGGSTDNLKGVLGETVTYKWRFKVPTGFQPSSNFTHIHQVKAVDGDDSSPLFTLTPRYGTPNTLQLLYTQDSSTSADTRAEVNLSLFENTWVEAIETIKIGTGTTGTYAITIKKVTDGTTILSYSSNAIQTIRTSATDPATSGKVANSFIRPKWGIYRSLLDSGKLRDDSMRFSDISISEIVPPTAVLTANTDGTVSVSGVAVLGTTVTVQFPDNTTLSSEAGVGGAYGPITSGVLLSSGNVITTYVLNGNTSPEATIQYTAPPVVSNQSFCNSGTVANLTATGTLVKWYAAASGGGVLATTTALATGTYYVTQTVNTLESARKAVSVTSNTTAAPTASAQALCGSATIASLAATGIALQWYSAATSGSALASTTALTTAKTYYVSQTLNSCESTRTSVAITLNSTAVPTASAQAICNSGTVANLTATGTALKWYAASTGGSALATTTALTAGTYYVSQTLNDCESATVSSVVTLPTCILSKQVLGEQAYHDGGFEGQSGVLGTTTQSATNNIWKSSTSSNIATVVGVFNTSTPRSGNTYLTQTLNATTPVATQSGYSKSTFGASATTNVAKWVTFYYKPTPGVTQTTNNLQIKGGYVYTDNAATPATQQLYGATVLVPSSTSYTKYSKAVALPANLGTSNTQLALYLKSVAGGVVSVDVDDMVVYDGTAEDILAPNTPASATIANVSATGLGLSWTQPVVITSPTTEASSGVDGGGYVVVRYASNPNADNDPNVNGIYAVRNTITNGTGSLVGTVVYIGTGTSFTDSSLNSSTPYYYKVYAVDKAFNYSPEATVTGTTTGPLASPVASAATALSATGFTANWGTVSNASTYDLYVYNANTQSNIVGWTFPASWTAATGFAPIADIANSNNTSMIITQSSGTVTAGEGSGGVGTYSISGASWYSNLNKYWEVQVNTIGYRNVKVSSKLFSTAPKDFKLQYKIGSGGTYADVDSGSFVCDSNWTTGVLSNLALPAACDNATSVYLRWINYTNIDYNTGTALLGGTARLDDIYITGGALTSQSISPISISGTSSAVSGLSVGTYYYDVIASGSGYTSSAKSNLITALVSIPQSVADYKSVGDANTSTATNWQYYNGISWLTATVAPSSTNNITISAGNVVSLGTNFTVDSGKTLTVTGTINLAGYLVSGTGTFTLSSGASMKLGNNTSIASAITTTNKTFDVAANYFYDGTIAQTTASLPTATMTGNVTVSNAAGVTMAAALKINTPGTLEVTATGKLLFGDGNVVSATIGSGTFTYSGSGNFTVATGATLSITSSKGICTGTSNGSIKNSGTRTFNSGVNYIFAKNDGANAITMGTSFGTAEISATVGINNLTINNPLGVYLPGAISITAGEYTPDVDITVNGVLNFVSGKLIANNGISSVPQTTGTKTVTIGASGSITGAGTGWVIGNLKKMTSLGENPSFPYAIGDAINYTPLALTFSGITTAAGGLTARVNGGDHVQSATSGFDSAKSVNRTWTLTNDALAGFGTYAAAFTYARTDNDTSTTPANYKVNLYNSSAWSILASSGTSDIAATAIGITSFGDFAIGEAFIPPTATITAGDATTFCAGGSVTLSANTGTGLTYLWSPGGATTSSITATASGSYTVKVTNAGGETTSAPTTVTINPNVTPIFAAVAAICTGGSLSALPLTSTNGITGTWSPALNNAATTEYTFTPTAGQCATTAAKTITVNGLTTIGSITTSICAGGSYTWPATGLAYTTAKTGLTYTLGCNTATLNLTITAPTTAGSESVSACGTSYIWPLNGQSYTSSGTYTHVVGCNTATLILTLTPSTTTGSESVSACGSSYTWPLNGQSYTASGTYPYVVGCNTATLTLTLTLATNHTAMVSAFNTYTWANNGETYTTSGTKTGTTTNCVTELLDLTIKTTEIPTSPIALCAGKFVADAIGSTSMKFYKDNLAKTIVPLAAATTKLVSGTTYYVTEMINGEETARVPVVVNLTALVAPTTIASTEAKVICKYMGSPNLVTFTTTPVSGASSYTWNVSSITGAAIVGSATGESITVSFEGVSNVLPANVPGLIGSVTVDSNNALGCPSGKPKVLALTTKAPTAAKSVALSSTAPVTAPNALGVPVTTITAVKKAGNFVGTTNTLYLIVSDPSLTADHYDFVLPEGVRNVTGATSVEGSTTLYRATCTSTSTVLTFNLDEVQASNTALAFTCTSVGGCGAASKTLSVARAEAGTPKGLVLTDATDATAPGVVPAVLPIVLKKLDSYTGSLKTRTLTLTATPNVTAGSEASKYKWVLPAGVTTTATPVAGEANTYTSESNVISVNLANVGTETGFTFKVYGVNGNGASLASKDLACTSAAPKAPAAIYAGTNTSATGTKFLAYNPSCGTVTISVPAVIGVDNDFEIMSGGATIASHELGSNVATVDLSTAASSIVLKSTVVIRVYALTMTGPAYKDYIIKIGSACSPPTRIAPEAATATEKFSAVAYPNPSTEGFRVKSSNGRSFGVQVYDMLGRSIEQRQMTSDAQIGSNYAKGIYNVIVNQGANVKTLRVIKQ